MCPWIAAWWQEERHLRAGHFQHSREEMRVLNWSELTQLHEQLQATVPDRVKKKIKIKKISLLYLQKGQVGPLRNLRKTMD